MAIARAGIVRHAESVPLVLIGRLPMVNRPTVTTRADVGFNNVTANVKTLRGHLAPSAGPQARI